MDKSFWIETALGIALLFVPYFVKSMPPYLAFAGFCLCVSLAVWTGMPDAHRPPVASCALYTIALVSAVLGLGHHIANRSPVSLAIKPAPVAVQPEPGATKEPKVGVQLRDTQGARIGTISVRGEHDIGVNVERSKGFHIGSIHADGGAPPKPAPLPQITANQALVIELNRQRAQILAIGNDWMGSNDGIPPTEAGILDKATPYINEQLKIRGENWQFDRTKRRQLGFPPAIGDSYPN